MRVIAAVSASLMRLPLPGQVLGQHLERAAPAMLVTVARLARGEGGLPESEPGADAFLDEVERDQGFAAGRAVLAALPRHGEGKTLGRRHLAVDARGVVLLAFRRARRQCPGATTGDMGVTVLCGKAAWPPRVRNPRRADPSCVDEGRRPLEPVREPQHPLLGLR